MKHTPGPWKFKSVIRPDAYRVQSGDDFVCEAKHLHDAVLIAAAPEMLDALKRISLGLTLPEDDVQRAIRKIADAVIDKAEGAA